MEFRRTFFLDGILGPISNPVPASPEFKRQAMQMENQNRIQWHSFDTFEKLDE